jgi:L-threonylcarbamoyladenylate synthase
MTAPILEPTEDNLALAAACIKRGGVVVAPSDTNLALTLDPWNEQAIERAFRIKQRPATSPLTLFVLEPAEWALYTSLQDCDLVDRVVERFWPGPLNIVVPRNGAVPDAMVRNGPTVAIGCISNPALRGLLRHVGRPLTMTSANLSGQADGVLVDLAMAVAQVGDRVDYILTGAVGGTTQSSTIVSFVGAPTILRKGDITAQGLNQVAPVFTA